MFFIWKGYGFLVPIITVVIVLVVTMVVKALFPASNLLGPCLGALASAAVLWFIGKNFNSPAKNRVVIDKATGQEFLLKPDHSLFFIKIQYWAFIVGAFGLILLISLITGHK